MSLIEEFSEYQKDLVGLLILDQNRKKQQSAEIKKAPKENILEDQEEMDFPVSRGRILVNFKIFKSEVRTSRVNVPPTLPLPPRKKTGFGVGEILYCILRHMAMVFATSFLEGKITVQFIGHKDNLLRTLFLYDHTQTNSEHNKKNWLLF